MTLTKKQQQIINLRDVAIKKFNIIKPQFEELEKGYLSELEARQVQRLKKAGKSHIAQQLIKAKVRKIVRDIMKTYFSSDILANIEIENDDALSQVMQKRLNSYSNQKINLYTILRPLVEQSIIYGTNIAKVYWSKKDNQLRIQARGINEVLIDPYARNHYEAKYFIDRFYMSIADIKRTYKTKLKGIDLSSVSRSDEMAENQEVDLGEYKRVMIVEVYRKIDDDWYLSSMIGDDFLRTDVKLNDGNPLLFGKIFPQFVPFGEKNAIPSYGDSYIAPMIPLQKQFVVTRNQQMDAVYEQLNPRFLVTRNSGLRDDDLVNRARKISVSSLEQIKELPAPNISQSIFDVNRIDEEIQEVGGLPKLVQGISTQNDPSSATGMSLMNDSGNSTIDDIITSFNESFFEPLIQRMLRLIYKYEADREFVNFDRTKSIAFKIAINAGIGAMSREIRINNLENGILGSSNSIKVFLESGLMDKAFIQANLLEELTIEKMKLLGIKNVDKKIQKAKEEYERFRAEGQLASEQNAVSPVV